MPRTVEQILKHADELAQRFEEYEPSSDDERDPAAVVALRDAVVERSGAERHLREAIVAARKSGVPWSMIGSYVGTSGEAARQRYRKYIA